MLSARATTKQWFLLGFAALALLSLRLVEIDADVPTSVWSENVGEFIDEGYKILDARNIVLFGSPRIGPEDDNSGWIRKSPITQWPLVAVFRVLRPDLASARLVSVLSFAIFIVGYLLGPGRRYAPGLTLLGLLMLGISHILLIFSRTAIFEMPLIAAAYTPLFYLGGRASSLSKRAIVLLVVAALVAAFGIKASGLLYGSLALAGVLASHAWRTKSSFSIILRRLGPIVAFLAAITVLFFFVGEWAPQFQVEPETVIRSISENQLILASPLIVACGLFCIAQWLLTAPYELLGSPYRTALVALALGGPLILAVLEPVQLRYHVPILPAYGLLTLEWIDSRSWNSDSSGKVSWYVQLAGLAIMTLFFISLFHATNRYIAGPWILGGPGSPTETAPIRLTFVVLASMFLALAAWIFRRSVFGPRSGILTVAFLATLGLCVNLWLDIRFWLSPTHHQREIAAALQTNTPSGSVITGDWAPFFTPGTDTKALWMSERFGVNTVSRLLETRPDFLLFVEDRDIGVPDTIRQMNGVDLGDPLFESSYLDRQIMLFPILYSDFELRDQDDRQTNSLEE